MTARSESLPTVGGERVETTLADLDRRARCYIGDEQRKPNPDNALIAVLCDTVRLIRAYERVSGAADLLARHGKALPKQGRVKPSRKDK